MSKLILRTIGEDVAEDGRTRQGVVMVIVLSILLILAMMGTVFVTFQMMEKRVAKNFTDDVRAKMLAQSGLEHGTSELLRIMGAGGGFTTNNGGTYSTMDGDRTWVFFGTEKEEDGPPTVTPVYGAENPSFAIELDGDPSSGAPNPKLYVSATTGASRGISGHTAGGTYASNGDTWTIKVTDQTSKININDGVEWGSTHSVNQNLTRVLNILGAMLTPAMPTLGTTVLANRPSGGYTSITQLLGFLTQAQYQAARNHLTVGTWKDTNVANPVPLSSYASVLSAYPVTYVRPAGPTYRYGHQKNNLGASVTIPLRWYDPATGNNGHNGIWEHDALNPMWIEVVARSPVNVNSATREVLIALLTNLQGFFSSIERRRDRPLSSPTATAYSWLGTVYTYDSAGTAPTGGSDGDECGFIYSTAKFVNSSSVVSGEVSAPIIADEMIACRMKAACAPHGGTHNYSDTAPSPLPFRGGFRTWAQFNQFVDYLVAQQVIWDTRGSAYFYDYDPNGTIKPGGSAIQNYMASQAAGDVLKANFNPNLTLNELNPNRNVWTHVDKTDLIVNSTEFCFMPLNGVYEIQSLGEVLVPDSGTDIWASPNTVVAEKSMTAEIRLWEATRVTNQKQFYGKTSPGFGNFGLISAGNETNFNQMTESYPEVDNGPITEPDAAASDIGRTTEYSGYVALATYGGSYHNGTGTTGTTKPKNTYRTTSTANYAGVTGVPAGVACMNGEKIHAHWDVDHFAHRHRDGDAGASGLNTTAAAPCGKWVLFYPNYPNLDEFYNGGASGYAKDGRFTMTYNYPDKVETVSGPYAPVDASATHRYRQCRSFRSPNAGSFAFPVTTYAPGDLRVDGAYGEKGSSFGYGITDYVAFRQSNTPSNVGLSSWRMSEGTIAFWMKPNWFPEATGKARALVSVARYRYHMHSYLYKSGGGWGIGYCGGRLHHGGSTSGSCVCGVTEGPGGPAPGYQYHCNGGHAANAWDANFNPFTLYYLPAHANNSGSVSSTDGDYPDKTSLSYTNDIGKFRPASFGFGMGIGEFSGGDHIQWPMYGLWPFNDDGLWEANIHYSCVTPSLNHEGHGSPINSDPLMGEDGKFNRLRGHEWIHVMLGWQLPAPGSAPPSYEPAFSSAQTQIYINGEALSMAFNDNYTGDPGWPPARYVQWWLNPYGLINSTLSGTTIQGGSAFDVDGNGIVNNWGSNTLRIGGEGDALSPLDTSLPWKNGIGTTGASPLPRMWTADATFDEFYEWTDRTTTTVTNYATNVHYKRGRYYKPADATATDGIYTSPPINISAAATAARLLPPSDSVAPPPPSEGGGIGEGTNTTPPAGGAGSTTLLGVSWTCHAETYATPGGQPASLKVPAMRDWNVAPPTTLFPAATADVNGFKMSTVVDLYVSGNDGATFVGPLRNDAYSAVMVGGVPMVPADPTKIRFRAKFRTGAVATTVLLASPVLDDVTIYYSRGGPTYLTLSVETLR